VWKYLDFGDLKRIPWICLYFYTLFQHEATKQKLCEAKRVQRRFPNQTWKEVLEDQVNLEGMFKGDPTNLYVLNALMVTFQPGVVQSDFSWGRMCRKVIFGSATSRE